MLNETCKELLRLLRTQVEENTQQNMGNLLEIKKLPVIVLTGPTLQERRNMRSVAELTATDPRTNTFVKETTPRWYNLNFAVLLAADHLSDLLDRVEHLSRTARAHPVLTVTQDSTERTRRYHWDWTALPSNTTTPNHSGVYEAQGTLTVYDIEIYSGHTRAGTLIQTVSVTLTPETPRGTNNTENKTIGKGEQK